MPEQLAYLNGRIVPVASACVSILDRGLLYGDGVFETIRVMNGAPIRLEGHIDRLRRGVRVLYFEEALRALDIPSAIARLLDANQLTNARVRLTITRGEAEGAGLGAHMRGGPTVIITAQPLTTSDPTPARVILSTIRRDEANPLSSIKSLNYLPGVLAMNEALAAGADDALLINTLGCVAEGTSGNLFMATGNRLITPALDQGPLPGTARAALIGLAPSLGLEVAETAITPDDLFLADELFLTNAIQLARPICEVNDTRIGKGTFTMCELVRKAL